MRKPRKKYSDKDWVLNAIATLILAYGAYIIFPILWELGAVGLLVIVAMLMFIFWRLIFIVSLERIFKIYK